MIYDPNEEKIGSNLTPLKEVKKMSRKEKRKTDLPGNPVKGRVYFEFANFFFVLVCIGFGITIFSVALPVFLVLIGLGSVLCWIVLIMFLSIFTLGMVWLSKDFKAFISSWQGFNDGLFNSANNTAELAKVIIPPTLIAVGALIVVSWIFLVVGLVNDKERKKAYTGRVIALGIMTALYLAAMIFNLVTLYNNSAQK